MSIAGAFVGALVGLGAWSLFDWAMQLRRPSLSVRVVPYMRDLPQRTVDARMGHRSAVSGVFGPFLRQGAGLLDRALGGATSIRRRLERAGSERSVPEFRVEQVQWGLLFFAAASVYCLLSADGGSSSVLSSLLICIAAFVAGVWACDQRLSSQVKERERRMLTEFPALAELLALSVVAGEAPSAALARVVDRASGVMADELSVVLGQIRTGETVAAAFDQLAARSGVAAIGTFAQAIAVSAERGTPLADVLHAQAADVREAARRELIETGARKEVLMMVPVVFLVLPITILFAFWPGAIGLSMVAM